MGVNNSMWHGKLSFSSMNNPVFLCVGCQSLYRVFKIWLWPKQITDYFKGFWWNTEPRSTDGQSRVFFFAKVSSLLSLIDGSCHPWSVASVSVFLCQGFFATFIVWWFVSLTVNHKCVPFPRFLCTFIN